MTDRNSEESVNQDLEFLESMKANAQKLHDAQYDTTTTDYLLQQITDWIDELNNSKN